MSEETKKRAELLKNEGNKFFGEKKYELAIYKYEESLKLEPSAAVYSNKAYCNILLEKYGEAIEDASKAIDLDPKFIKGYYRRGVAKLSLCKTKEALKDFRYLHEKYPKSKEIASKYHATLDAYEAEEFEKAIAIEEEKPLSTTLNYSSMSVPKNYDGKILKEKITEEFIDDMIDRFKSDKKIDVKFIYQILIQSYNHLKSLRSLIYVTVKEGEKITVCGDTHGQFFDLLNIFKINGKPSPSNPYVFNGDFVDRGSWSFEVITTLLAYKLLYPKSVHLTRGNHESKSLNKIYGFEGEVMAKYNGNVYNLFQEVFNWLPLSCVLNGKVMIVHGGLFSKEGVKLKDIEQIDRNRQIPDSGLMSDMLWSDPQEFNGRKPNRRGISILFGPDVTKSFLKDNGLELIVRSHEVKQQGYEYHHDGKLITIFSAPNYCDQVGNLGAFIHFGSDMKPKITTFPHVEHPKVKPMAYANRGLF